MKQSFPLCSSRESVKMMSSSEMREIRDAGNEMQDGLKITAARFDKIESDGVNLQCVNSTDFMVGKQTNFNGPVTIINYADGEGLESPLQSNVKPPEVVIKDRIIAPGVTSSIENFVKKKAEEEFQLSQLFKGKGDRRYRVQGFCMRNFLKIPVFAWTLIFFFFALAGIITLSIELSDDGYPGDAEIFPGETRNYTLYNRKNWGAAEERSSVAMKLPVPYVIISSTNGKPCEGLKECGKILRQQQLVQMKRSQSDIYPNFLVSSDGFVYEGRGWYKRNAFLGFANSRSIEISFIGEFSVYAKPTQNQTEAAKAFIEYALKEKILAETYRLLPASARGILLSQEYPTMGKNLYEAVKDWKNFEPDPYREFFPMPATP